MRQDKLRSSFILIELLSESDRLQANGKPGGGIPRTRESQL